MNTDEEQIDFGLDHLPDFAKGEFDPADYPGAMSAVISKVLGLFVASSGQAQMMKVSRDEFALQWIEPHPEALSHDEYTELRYGKKIPFYALTKTQDAEIVQFFRRQKKLLPSRKRELLLSRKEALLLLTALYMPNEFLWDLEAALC